MNEEYSILYLCANDVGEYHPCSPDIDVYINNVIIVTNIPENIHTSEVMLLINSHERLPGKIIDYMWLMERIR